MCKWNNLNDYDRENYAKTVINEELQKNSNNRRDTTKQFVKFHITCI